MDLRPYHDGMGMDTFEKQYNGGLEITYRGLRAGLQPRPRASPGTSEVHLWVIGRATPARARRSARCSGRSEAPPLLVNSPPYLQGAGSSVSLWSPVDRGTPARAAVEDRLAAHFEYYEKQREQHRWYGFWNYGDVMHTYDTDRHEWRYDVGRFCLGQLRALDRHLAVAVLPQERPGRRVSFREAMTRHTGEVDVYHLGAFAPLGSRHNVQHWGCSASSWRNQHRDQTAAIIIYLTATSASATSCASRVEAGAGRLVQWSPGRKLGVAAKKGDPAGVPPWDATKIGVSFGTDWGSIAGAWRPEWRMRRATPDARPAGREHAHARPAAAWAVPNGLTINFETGAFAVSRRPGVSVSHLQRRLRASSRFARSSSSCCDVPEFPAGLGWIIASSTTPAPRNRSSGSGRRCRGKPPGRGTHVSTGPTPAAEGDAALAQRAWAEFNRGGAGSAPPAGFEAKKITGPAVLRPVDEAAWVSSNGTAQWGLAAIECLALVPEAQPES